MIVDAVDAVLDDMWRFDEVCSGQGAHLKSTIWL
jgi:hypothetical protein